MTKIWYVVIVIVVLLGAFLLFAPASAPNGTPQAGMPVPGTETPETIVTPEAAPSNPLGGARGGVEVPSGIIVEPVTAEVTISNFSFTPAELRIVRGTTVTWTNEDTVRHNAVSEGNFLSPLLAKGESWSYTFTTAGTYDYRCTPHPFMRGKIVVE